MQQSLEKQLQEKQLQEKQLKEKQPEQPRIKQRCQHLREGLERVGALTAEALYPYRCPLCQRILRRREGLICPECYATLPWNNGEICLVCGRPLEDAGYLPADAPKGGRTRLTCRACAGKERLFRSGRSAFVYTGLLRESVLRMKFQNQRCYLPFFGWALARAGEDFFRKDPPDCLLPVPIHPGKRRARGFDQCALLARELSALTDIPVAEGYLIRVRETLPQKGLSARERRENLEGAFRVSDPGQGLGSVLLLDDIYTTGATIDACCAALLDAGTADIRFLTICAVFE